MNKHARAMRDLDLYNLPFDKEHYRDLKRKHIARLLFTYLTPLLILIVYFYWQYNQMAIESRSLHMKAIAENQSNTLNLFLLERIVNLRNLIDDPKLGLNPQAVTLKSYLSELTRNSETFVDIGYFDYSGIQTAYEGPYPALEKRNYSSENWYQRLITGEDNFVITDIYLGFRNRPHFTIAVRRLIEDQYVVLRATLDPERIYEYMRSLEGASEVSVSIVNKDGYYQLVTPHIGTSLEASSFVPPLTPRQGAEKIKIKGKSQKYAYSWLETADWALIVQENPQQSHTPETSLRTKLLIISFIMVGLTVIMIILRSRKLIELQIETDKTRVQLEHASKLASVGELAAGIAHEINNPLAVINEEAGLIKDFMNPEFGETMDSEQLREHLDNIQESVFRCRDITHKLLRFVRKTDIELKSHNIHDILDGVVDGLLIREMEVSNIEIVKNYQNDLPNLLTDKNQLQQVILNIINNGVDALQGKPGKITITTSYEDNDENINVAITDTGKGMSSAHLEKIFLPFFTTKEVGKGTGLGLSVSYGIIKNLGGMITVQSKMNHGSTFTLVLPKSPKTISKFKS